MYQVNLEKIIGKYDKTKIEDMDLTTVFDNRNDLFTKTQREKLDVILEIIAEYTTPKPQISKIREPDDIYKNIYKHFIQEDTSREHFFLICLNTKNIIKNVIKITSGAPDIAHVPVSVVMKKALLSGCSQIAIAHNHPSGNPTPSQEDIHLTKMIIDSCKTVGLTFVDHIIIGGSLEYISLKAEELF